MQLIIYLAWLLPLYVQTEKHPMYQGYNLTSEIIEPNKVHIDPKVGIKLHAKDIDNQWNKYKKRIGRSFVNKVEENERKLVFAINKAYIEKHNRLVDLGLKSYRLELNAFADMTPEEFKAKYITHIPHQHEDWERKSVYNSSRNKIRQQLPETVDLRESGFVTEVKNQEIPEIDYCGSCWAFAAAGALEGHLFRKTGKLVELSAQFFVDCDTNNHGCRGGDTYRAFEWAKEFGWLETEKNYPYKGKKMKCPFNKTETNQCQENRRSVAYVKIPKDDEEAIMEVIATKGPVSIIFDAGDKDFQFFSGKSTDVYYSEKCSKHKEGATHGALIIGYGTINKTKKYWLVKNSYGKDWGDNGYFKIVRNKNVCGIANEITYPIV